MAAIVLASQSLSRASLAPNSQGIPQGQRRVHHNWHVEPGAALNGAGTTGVQHNRARAPGTGHHDTHGGSHAPVQYQEHHEALAPSTLHIEHQSYDSNHFAGSNPIHGRESDFNRQQKVEESRKSMQPRLSGLSGKGVDAEESRKSMKPRLSGLTGEGVDAAPDNISKELWEAVESKGGMQFAKQFADFANWIQAPQGFNDAALWEKLSVEQKHVFLKAENSLRYEKKRCIQNCPGIGDSHVGKFFLDFDADDFNFDAGVNAFALLNALVLTIPYGCVMNLNGEFFDELYAAWQLCEPNEVTMATVYGGEAVYHNYIIRNLCVANYGSICGLIMATLYYVFKPTDSTGLTRWSKKKIRILVMCIFISTIAAIFGIMFVYTGIIQVYSRRSSEYCELNPAADSMWKSGTAAIVLSLVLAVYLMW